MFIGFSVSLNNRMFTLLPLDFTGTLKPPKGSIAARPILLDPEPTIRPVNAKVLEVLNSGVISTLKKPVSLKLNVMFLN